MDFNLYSRITVPDDVIIQQTSDGESIILNTRTENYFGLDETGTIFYNSLLNSMTINEALLKIHNTYEVENNTLISDLQSFISDLKKNKLIEIEG